MEIILDGHFLHQKIRKRIEANKKCPMNGGLQLEIMENYCHIK